MVGERDSPQNSSRNVLAYGRKKTGTWRSSFDLYIYPTMKVFVNMAKIGKFSKTLYRWTRRIRKIKIKILNG